MLGSTSLPDRVQLLYTIAIQHKPDNAFQISAAAVQLLSDASTIRQQVQLVKPWVTVTRFGLALHKKALAEPSQYVTDVHCDSTSENAEAPAKRRRTASSTASTEAPPSNQAPQSLQQQAAFVLSLSSNLVSSWFRDSAALATSLDPLPAAVEQVLEVLSEAAMLAVPELHTSSLAMLKRVLQHWRYTIISLSDKAIQQLKALPRAPGVPPEAGILALMVQLRLFPVRTMSSHLTAALEQLLQLLLSSTLNAEQQLAVVAELHRHRAPKLLSVELLEPCCAGLVPLCQALLQHGSGADSGADSKVDSELATGLVLHLLADALSAQRRQQASLPSPSGLLQQLVRVLATGNVAAVYPAFLVLEVLQCLTGSTQQAVEGEQAVNEAGQQVQEVASPAAELQALFSLAAGPEAGLEAGPEKVRCTATWCSVQAQDGTSMPGAGPACGPCNSLLVSHGMHSYLL
jgi:hypothetical protein